MSNLLDVDVDVASGEDEEEEFDEETGELRARPNGTRRGAGFDDSSEEEEEDDDEEAAAEIRKGFIVEDEEEDEEARAERRREKRKRRREQREEEEAMLDAEDLDLIGEANPDLEARQSTQSKFKRLRLGHREDRTVRGPRGVEDMFSDENEEEPDDRRYQREPDEFDDFIEEDEFPDEERDRMLEEQEVARPGRRAFTGLDGLNKSGMDEATQEDMQAAFGDGTEYDWALEMQAHEDEEKKGEGRALELKDVFEPSQLEEKMLTEEDNEIRMKDVPERFQIARKPFKKAELSEEEAAKRAKDGADYVTKMLLPEKRLERHLHEPFQKAVANILRFINEEDFEIPFIFQHRKDYLIHASHGQGSPDSADQDPSDQGGAVRLLNQDDMWEALETDLKFKAIAEKRDALNKSYDNLKSVADITDDVFEELLPAAVIMEEVQDVQDYLHFQYSAQLKDVNALEAQANGNTLKRARAGKSVWEKIRAGKVYNMVRAYGITADAFAQNNLAVGRRQYTEDPTERPDDMADSLLDPPEYTTGAQIHRAARAMFVEELVMNPRLRKHVRGVFYNSGVLDCVRTEKGARHITEDHRYYEFKYLRNQSFPQLATRPEFYLRMLKAEEEGLVEVKFRLNDDRRFKKQLYSYIESDSFSDIADAWNVARREVVDMAWPKLERIIGKGIKETLKSKCEDILGKLCRTKYSSKLDQAPYKPKGMALGTIPRVFALSNGNGVFNRDAICWCYMDEDGRYMDSGKFTDLRPGNADKYLPDGKDVARFVEAVRQNKPDVIAMSGFSVETKKLYKDLQEIVDKHDLGIDWEDEDGNGHRDPIDIVLVNDEVARLYHTSDRSAKEFPGTAPLVRYCIGLARYMQNPLLEYAALGRSIVSISFDPNQDLIPQDKLMRWLETAMVDMVNLVGVEINEAAADARLANLLPYVCGLGPRKAAQLLKVINLQGGVVNTREELVGDPEKKRLPAVGIKVWQNCASFLFITYDDTEPDADYLDNTRVHPEDYDLGRKMAADALDLDEEDIQAEKDENGPSAVIRRLIKEDNQDRVNDLLLEGYAEQLERDFKLKKRATLETIRAELQTAYEELRRNFALLSTDELFTQLTSETKESLTEGMIVPVTIRRVFMDHIEVKLDCGVEGGVSEAEYPEGVGGDRGVDPRQVYQNGQTVQAKILFLNRKAMTCQLSFREDALRRPYRKDIDHPLDEWDELQEDSDKRAAAKEKEDVSGRAQRVIKHPLFRPFNSAQAEEYLGSQGRGDVVIRPSSKGLDHLAVTWKVSDNIYQHIDVLELDKENEFSVGKTLKIGGKYTYSDLDELIVNHVKAMAKKVDEMMGDDKYQNSSRAQTEQWLTTYLEANPKRSMYAFCINPKFPGYFHLCFKPGQRAELCAWPVKVIPNAFEMHKNAYPDMRALKNGFKLLFQNMSKAGAQGMTDRRR